MVSRSNLLLVCLVSLSNRSIRASCTVLVAGECWW